MTALDLPAEAVDLLVGGDVPVSNQPADEVVVVPTAEEPSSGADPAGVSEGLEVSSDAAPESAESLSMFVPPSMMLPDIAEASFGPQPETVHGPDNRTRVTNTDVYPWRVHCSLLITARDGSLYSGTGWFIGPRTVVTAGHVVFIHAPGTPRHGWVRSIRVMPGRNGNTLPYGSETSTNFRSVQGWTGSRDENYDYGAIILSNPLGDRTGWLGFANDADATLRSLTVNISGYPGDKPAGTQWFAANRIASFNARKVYYDIDTFGGQSGAAVYRLTNGARYAVAVHAYGGPVTNSGTRINGAVFANLLSWKQNP